MPLSYDSIAMHEACDPPGGLMPMEALINTAGEPPVLVADRRLSTFERVFSTHAPILESLLLQMPTDSIFQLYHTSHHLRAFLRSYPTAWKYLSFRLLYPSGSQTRPLLSGNPDPSTQRQSRQYALDQLLMSVVLPFSPCLKSLELDNTAVSGQILMSTVLHARRETLEHLSVRGCKNVSLKYHIIPYLTMFGLQFDVDLENNTGVSPTTRRLALKSLYTYRCRHHRRRPYLSSSLFRRDSDSEPTHELVNVCHKLGIWTDTAWCTTPAGRCFRRRGYVSMRVPQGAPEVWVVFDRLWRSKNWIGPASDNTEREIRRDGRLWEHDEIGYHGEPLGTGDIREHGEGKKVPAHLRQSHRRFVDNAKCDSCYEDISERCEQCSVLMHCVGCRKTLCASCAYDRPYYRSKAKLVSEDVGDSFWWAPGALTSPCVMQEPPPNSTAINNNPNPNGSIQYPILKFHWCCTEPIFSGGGGISIGTPNRDVDLVRAAPLPRGQGWENPEYSTNEWSKAFEKSTCGDPKKPDHIMAAGHIEMMRWLLGPLTPQVSTCPRNLCQDCYDSPQWKVHCKNCSKPLCIEHDLRGFRLRICGYKDLHLEKVCRSNHQAVQHLDELGSPITMANVRQADIPELGRRSQSQDSNPAMNGIQESTTSSVVGDPVADVLTEAHSSVLQEFLHAEPLPDVHVARSGSPTNSNHSRSSSHSSVYFETSAEIPKWRGCQSFFCPPYRAVGDQRQRCTNMLRECTSCLIHVCHNCITNNPPCKCSYCEVNYLCPNCLRLRERDGTCRRAEEERAKREEKHKKDMEKMEDIIERKLANEVAEYAGQFLGRVIRGSERTNAYNELEHEAHYQNNSDMEATLEDVSTPIAD